MEVTHEAESGIRVVYYLVKNRYNLLFDFYKNPYEISKCRGVESRFEEIRKKLDNLYLLC
jgi:hypothetical protein